MNCFRFCQCRHCVQGVASRGVDSAMHQLLLRLQLTVRRGACRLEACCELEGSGGEGDQAAHQGSGDQDPHGEYPFSKPCLLCDRGNKSFLTCHCRSTRPPSSRRRTLQRSLQSLPPSTPTAARRRTAEISDLSPADRCRSRSRMRRLRLLSGRFQTWLTPIPACTSSSGQHRLLRRSIQTLARSS